MESSAERKSLKCFTTTNSTWRPSNIVSVARHITVCFYNKAAVGCSIRRKFWTIRAEKKRDWIAGESVSGGWGDEEGNCYMAKEREHATLDGRERKHFLSDGHRLHQQVGRERPSESIPSIRRSYILKRRLAQLFAIICLVCTGMF